MRRIAPRTKFTVEEDKNLCSIVENMNAVDWRVVADRLGGRTPRQCRERYNNYLAPNVGVKEWTESDDSLLIEQYKLHGPAWSVIRNAFPGRSCVNIKNRWAKLTHKSSSLASVEEPEPEQVLEAHQEKMTDTENIHHAWFDKVMNEVFHDLDFSAHEFENFI